jgi:tetratricopeptide (TPR) repeat protein
MEFRATTVAELLETDATDVIDSCDEFVRRQYWLREGGIVDRTDGVLDAHYTFRHAVFKHVFYHRLPATQRIAFHRRAARALERTAKAGIATTPAELASHHELGREYRAAVVNYSAAADNALGHYAPQEALELSEKALALLPSCAAAERPELELPLQAGRGMAFGAVLGIAADETTRSFSRVAELVDALPPSPARALLLNSAGWWLFSSTRYTGALELADRMQAVATTFDDRVLLTLATNLKGVTLTHTGRLREAADCLLESLRHYEQARDRLRLAQIYVDPGASLYANGAAVLLQLGLADQARGMVNQARVRGESVRQPLARLVAYWCMALVGVRMGDVHLADKGAAKLEELYAQTQLQQARAPSLWFRGWVEIQLGRSEIGIDLVRRGYTDYANSGTMSGSTETLSYIASAYVNEQRWDEAFGVLDEADSVIARFDERLAIPELLLLRGLAEFGRGDAASGRATLHRGLAEARQMESLVAEIRIASELVARHDRAPSDVGLLRSVYARVTEGFDILAYVRARELLAAAS